MQDVSIHRLPLCAAGPIFLLVKKEDTREGTAMLKFKDANYPTGEELYALEQWARRERDRALARSLAAVASVVKAFFVRGLAIAFTGPGARTTRKHGVRHA